jgi:hypothetical protein
MNLDLDRLKDLLKPWILGLHTIKTYTPIWTGSVTNPVINSGTLVGEYVVRGNMCLVNIRMVAGADTTFGSGNWAFSLPFTAYNGSHDYFGVAHVRDTGVNNYARMADIIPAGTTITFFNQLDSATNVSTITATTPFTWASGDVLNLQIEYRIA